MTDLGMRLALTLEYLHTPLVKYSIIILGRRYRRKGHKACHPASGEPARSISPSSIMVIEQSDPMSIAIHDELLLPRSERPDNTTAADGTSLRTALSSKSITQRSEADRSSGLEPFFPSRRLPLVYLAGVTVVILLPVEG